MKRTFLTAALCAAIVAGVAAASGGPSLLHPSSLHLKAPSTFKAKFTTTKGSFVVTVHRSWAPKGADRFYNLVYYHFYDNQPLFRVEPGFVVQWGISMKPAIAKAWQNAYLKDDPRTHTVAKGTIEFANAGANSRTTQIFVNLAANNLGGYPGFSPFGAITSGFSVFTHLYHGAQSTAANEHQALLAKYGAHWVHTNYPKLDWVKTARLVH